jgi:molecular chaperone DnaJ
LQNQPRPNRRGFSYKKGGDEAKFKEINEAYQTLADEKKRQQYDAFGSAGPGAGGFGGFDFSGFTGGGQGAEFDFGDIFSEFFGGGQGGGRVKRGRDISVAIEISFAESVFGTQRQILINKVGVCETCHGTGAKAGTKTKSCASCNGKGRLRETRQSFLGTFSITTGTAFGFSASFCTRPKTGLTDANFVN